MKCPFLIKRTEVFDDRGKKVGEDIEIRECIKNDCMVYDGVARLCSLLCSNMKAGVLIDNMKGSFKEIKDEIGQRTEAISGVISNTILTMQTAQNEVMVLGFDRLSEVFTNRLGEFRTNLSDKLVEFGEKGDKMYAKLEVMNTNFERLITINQLGLELVVREVDKILATDQVMLKKIETVDNLVNSFNSMNELLKGEISGLKVDSLNSLKEVVKYIDGVKTEISSMKVDQATALNSVQNTTTKFEDLFKKSNDTLTTMSDMMRNLNNNYIESLQKIAGLAESMRKGVEKVGEGLHDSVKGLVSEMKKEVGALEKQHEKTFGDIAKLATRFEELNDRIRDMTKEVQKEFKESFERQAQLSDYNKGILESIKGYFEKEDARYKEERLIHRKKEGLDHFDRATLYYYRGNYELASNEINKALEIDKTAEYLNLKGLLLVELGRFSDSQRTYTEALKLEPDLAEINNNLGLLYLRMKKLDDAVVSFQEAVKKNVNYALAYVNLGKALIDLERFDDAIIAYTRALEIDPSNREASEAIKLYKEGKIGE